jgi:hypothetical protein
MSFHGLEAKHGALPSILEQGKCGIASEYQKEGKA